MQIDEKDTKITEQTAIIGEQTQQINILTKNLIEVENELQETHDVNSEQETLIEDQVKLTQRLYDNLAQCELI